MKIRISGNSIRLRLTQTEVVQFVITGKVNSTCQIGNNLLTYSIIQEETDFIFAQMSGQSITICVPLELAKHWDTDDRVGFDTIDKNGLYILIEKDFQCLKPRSHEDESDNFPNPQSTIDTYD